MVDQRWNRISWIDLGAFPLTAGASVSLGNITLNDHALADPDGRSIEVSIAWDSIAFTAGEGVESYYVNSDVGGNTPGQKNACHRSAGSYPVQAYGIIDGMLTAAACTDPSDHLTVGDEVDPDPLTVSPLRLVDDRGSGRSRQGRGGARFRAWPTR